MTEAIAPICEKMLQELTGEHEGLKQREDAGLWGAACIASPVRVRRAAPSGRSWCGAWMLFPSLTKIKSDLPYQLSSLFATEPYAVPLLNLRLFNRAL